MRRCLPLVALMLAMAALAGRLLGQPAPLSCAPATTTGMPHAEGDADLYCIELLQAASVEQGNGIVRLLPPPSPFGAAVTPSGEHLHDLRIELRDLPEPSTLGDYTTYIAWATTPQLDPVLKLGVVGNGTATLGPVSFDRFLVLVTAEASDAVAERTGRLVLRGTSAGVRMQPHDMAYLLAGFLNRRDGAAAPGDAAAHHQHAAPDATGWTPPPMHPGVSMPPALMTLRPDVTSYLPAADEAAPLARPREIMRLTDGASLDLVAAPVRRVLFGRTVTMLGFNEQYPGPLIQVEQDSTITVRFTNRTDFPTAIHWHGLRLDNRFDGVPHVTQDPVEPGATFEYRVYFKDAGLYWYHPHHREDALQDLGLYGNILVHSREPGYFGPAHRDEFLMLDDLLAADSGLVGYGLEAPTHALMGRFGNQLLVNGEPQWQARASRGEVVRFYLTNVSSTRVFNVSWQGAAVRMKVVASDLGRFEREAWVDNVTIAPAERYVVDVRFEAPGEATLVNRIRAIDHVQARFFDETTVLGTVTVAPAAAAPDHARAFDVLRHNRAVSSDIEPFRRHFDRPVDKALTITLRTGELPFPIGPLMNFESVYRHPVEWTGTMPEMDWVVTARNAQWLLREPSTGRENMDITWRFKVGDVVKLRFVNDRSAQHAMQHPIHVHGQRLLLLAMNGVPNQHLVWKDTVLLPTGFVADVLLEITNPGKWMLHCHVAEHIEAGMRMVFEVEP